VADPLDLLREFVPSPDGGSSTPADGARRYVVLDVFAKTALEGNPLAVVLDGRGLEDQLMQRLAREFNLSETVFMLPPRSRAQARVRIFTPSSELPFAGHPVLGSAVVVAAALGREQIVLETARGETAISVLPAAEGRAAFARMAQPIPQIEPFGRPRDLLAALRVDSSTLPVELYDNGPRHVFVALDGEQAVARLAPDLGALSELGAIGVSCFAGDGRNWHTRMFAPGLGVPEDPATGSAAGPLAVHLARHGRIGFGEEIEIRQGAEIGRPSLLYALAEGSSAAIERVEVAGSAVVVACGTLLA
jgi:trans-2,3-dihydro-3-hydroxyanthranilate isomerase